MSSNKKLPRFLTETEVHRMFETAGKTNPRDLQILKLLYYFGLRNTEMCNLSVEHIDLTNMTLKVIGSDKEKGIKGGKGGKDRFIPIIEINPLPGESGNIMEDLREWIGNRKKGFLIKGESADGTISDRHIRRIVKNYAAWAKILKWEEVHPHTLRHSYATHLKNMGVPLEVIQRLLGHARSDTTLIYAHMGIENLRQEVKKHVWIARTKKELPGLIKDINSESDPDKRNSLQQDLIIKIGMVQMGITPDDM